MSGSPENEGRRANRLAGESSPYLLQHAYNPVDWRPWGEEAFECARAEDRPIFLSIGYATCHWCHVMERESFEDDEVAGLLNSLFVPVKVDREERPDVDAVYMSAVMAVSGHGGWPMSVFLTPEGQPFYGGTYYPKTDQYGRPGFVTVLQHLAQAWKERRQEVLTSAASLTSAIAPKPVSGGDDITLATLTGCAAAHLATFDHEHGGFGMAPKFPRPAALSFLLAHASRSSESAAVEAVVKTLDAMAAGGIHDHLGGGFHRYSTDREWLVPHFEKMLYDQAQLAVTYLEAWQLTGEARHAEIVRDIADYVIRDLTDEHGGFHSAEDADSEGVEGKFYVWKVEEIREILGDEDADLFTLAYRMLPDGNFHDEATGARNGDCILHLDGPIAAVVAGLAPAAGAEPEAVATRLTRLRQSLLEARGARIRPLLDDKVLADWNGLMISALSRAGQSLGEPEYLRAAECAASFVLDRMHEGGRLLHRYRLGQVGIPAFLEDHAFMGAALLDLFQATGELRWLNESRRLADQMVERFWDEEGGGFFLADPGQEQLITRSKEIYDGALPSGNSAAAYLCLRLGTLMSDDALARRGAATLDAFSRQLGAPTAHFPAAHLAADWLLGPVQEIVLVGEPGSSALGALEREVDRRYLPRAVVARVPVGDSGAGLRAALPVVAERDTAGAAAAAHVCVQQACQLPATTAAELAAILAR